MCKIIKNNAAITPTFYDPIKYEPTKNIILSFTPEQFQDASAFNKEDELRKKLHNLLDDVISNPLDYQIKGKQDVILRGIF